VTALATFLQNLHAVCDKIPGIESITWNAPIGEVPARVLIQVQRSYVYPFAHLLGATIELRTFQLGQDRAQWLQAESGPVGAIHRVTIMCEHEIVSVAAEAA